MHLLNYYTTNTLHGPKRKEIYISPSMFSLIALHSVNLHSRIRNVYSGDKNARVMSLNNAPHVHLCILIHVHFLNTPFLCAFLILWNASKSEDVDQCTVRACKRPRVGFLKISTHTRTFSEDAYTVASSENAIFTQNCAHTCSAMPGFQNNIHVHDCVVYCTCPSWKGRCSFVWLCM